MKRKILTNTFYQIVSKGVGVTFSLLLTIIITKNLGVYQFGELIKTVSFVGLFYTPLDFGINAIAVKLYSREPNKKNHIASQLNLLRLIIATFLLVTISVVTLLLPGKLLDGYTPLVKQSIFILSFTLYIQAFIRTTNSIFQHLLLYKYTLATELIQNLIVLLTTIVAIKTTRNIIPIVAGYLIGGTFASLVQYYFATKFITIKITTPDLKFFKKLITASLSLGLIIILSTIHTKTDILLLTFYKSTLEVGVYGLVKRIFESVLTIPLFFSNSLYPVMLQGQSNKLLKQSTLFMLFVSIIIILLITFLSPLLVLIKPDFLAAIPLLKQISYTLPLFFTTAPLMWGMISRGEQHKLIFIYFQALIINLTICFTLIPKQGAFGGIIGLAVSELTTLLCLLYFTLKKHEHTNT